MGVPRFFKLPKHKTFEYTPMFYDKRKEEIEKIKKKYNTKDNLVNECNADEYHANIKGQMRNHYAKNYNSSRKISNLRLVIIIISLFALTYYLLFF